MFNQIPLGGVLSVGNVVKVLEKRFPYVEVSSILGVDSSYDTNRKVRGVELQDVWSSSVHSSLLSYLFHLKSSRRGVRTTSRRGSARCLLSCTTASRINASSWTRMNSRLSPCKRSWRPLPSTREPSTWSVKATLAWQWALMRIKIITVFMWHPK